MTAKVRQIKKEIEKLSDQERNELLDKLQDSVEEYLLAKIAHQRILKDSGKRYSWESLKKQSGF